MPVLIMKYHCIIAPYHRTVPVPSMKSHCTTPPYQRTALHNHDMSSHHCTVPSYRTLQQRTWLPYVPDFACILEMMVTPILNLHKFTWMLWMKPFLTKVVCFFSSILFADKKWLLYWATSKQCNFYDGGSACAWKSAAEIPASVLCGRPGTRLVGSTWCRRILTSGHWQTRRHTVRNRSKNNCKYLIFLGRS